MTQDVDVGVDPRPLAAHMEAFLADIQAAGFLVEMETARRAVAEAGMFQLLGLGESLKVDIYPLSAGDDSGRT